VTHAARIEHNTGQCAAPIAPGAGWPTTSKKPRCNFAGSTICQAYREFVGLVNDHLNTCFRHRELRGEQQQTRPAGRACRIARRMVRRA
jgi:hypothetical protein